MSLIRDDIYSVSKSITCPCTHPQWRGYADYLNEDGMLCNLPIEKNEEEKTEDGMDFRVCNSRV